jgi:hypothetical protein
VTSWLSELLKIKLSNLGLVKKVNNWMKGSCVLFLLNLKNKLEGFILAPLLTIGNNLLKEGSKS